MPLSPPLREAPRYPITFAIGVGAIIVSVRWWFLHDLRGFAPASGSLLHEPWTLLTSTFPHVDVIHLLFNLIWWWTFATRIERAWGPLRLLAIFGFLGIVSSGAEVALLRGGVGLSGVVYGLCALIWVVQRKYPDLQGVVTTRVMQMFAFWFVLCIVLTIANVWHVGNIAHGAGALAGWVLGRCIIADKRRTAWLATVLALVAATCVGATVARPWVNLTSMVSSDAALGYRALVDGKYDDAVRYLEAANLKQPDNTIILTNLGLAYQHKDRYHDALGVYKQAVSVDPALRPKLASTIAAILDHEAVGATKRGDRAHAKALVREALMWDPGDEYARKTLEWLGSAESELKQSTLPPE